MQTQLEISKFALLASLVVLPIYLFALSSNVCVSDSQIYYRPNIFFRLQTYGMSQIKEVRPRCVRTRRGWNTGLAVAMTDASVFDIKQPLLPSSERILAVLRSAPLNASQIHNDCPVDIRKQITP
jgi:hypothetical protein